MVLLGLTIWLGNDPLQSTCWRRIFFLVRSVFWLTILPRRILLPFLNWSNYSSLKPRLPMDTLFNIRSVLICLLAFAAFLRFDKLAELVGSDVEVDSEKF